MLSLKGFSNVFSNSMGRSNDGREAKELLQTVDGLLTKSSELLNSLPLPIRQFETFEYKHTELTLMVIEVQDDVRERARKRVFFETVEEKEMFQSDIRKLLQQCETYYNDVVSASRQVQGDVPSVSTSQGTSSDASTELPSKTDDPVPPWLSIVADAVSEAEKSSNPSVDSGGVGSTKRFIATVARTSQTDPTSGEVTSSADDNTYYRILLCVNDNKRAVV
ncbi:hypothetical protein FRC11_004117, partial [Ceratobasidium sp. 423]